MATLWIELHTRALHHKGLEDNAYLSSFASRIPRYTSGCACQEFYGQWVKNNPAKFGDNFEYFSWSVFLHNSVNIKLGRPSFSLEEAFRKYGMDPPLKLFPHLAPKPVPETTSQPNPEPTPHPNLEPTPQTNPESIPQPTPQPTSTPAPAPDINSIHRPIQIPQHPHRISTSQIDPRHPIRLPRLPPHYTIPAFYPITMTR
jgi:hypothetical protein